MPGDTTTVIIKPQDSTILTVASSDITVIQPAANVPSNREVTILNTSSATITVPSTIQLSDAIPLTPLETGSAGTSLQAARADHIHPILDMNLNGGNF